jgi:hypothetical protein
MIYRLYKQLPHSASRGWLGQAASRRVPSCVDRIDAAAFGLSRHALMNAGELLT